MTSATGTEQLLTHVMKANEMRGATTRAFCQCVALCMFFATDGFCQPTLEKLGDLPVTIDIADSSSLDFVDTLHGFFRSHGVLWATNDGGEQWSLVDLPLPLEPATGAAEFLPSGLILISQGSRMFIRKSYSSSWGAVEMPTAESGHFDSAFFLKDGKTGWAAGDRYERAPPGTNPRELSAPHWAIDIRSDGVYISHPVIFFTPDGGHTWSRQMLPPNVAGYSARIIHFIDENVGIATVEGSVITTTSGGQSWRLALQRARRLQGGDPAPRVMSAYVLDANHGWVSYDDGALMLTADGGYTWRDVIGLKGLPTPGNDSALVRFPDHLWFSSPLYGLCLHSVLPGMYSTRDGGRSWINLFPHNSVASFAALDRNHIWVIAGRSLYRASRLW